MGRCNKVLLAAALFGLLAFARPAAAQGGETAPAGTVSPYQAAIERAEEDLRRRETSDQPAGGWGVSEMLGLAALLAAVVLLLLATRWMRGGGGVFKVQGREMRLLDRMAVGRQTTLLLVRLRGKDYWLADGPGGVKLLDQWPAVEGVKTPPPHPDS